MPQFKWDERALTSAQIVEAYFREKITLEDFLAAMDARGISRENAFLLIDVRTSQLTVANIVSLYLGGIFTRDAAMEHLKTRGYPLEAAELLLSLGEKELTKSEVISLYLRGVIELPDAIQRLKILGYPDKDIPYLFELSENYPPKSDIKKMYDLGLIDETAVYAYFAQLGYTPSYTEYSALLLTQERILSRIEKLAEEIIDAYVFEAISHVEFQRYLGSLGYTREEIGIIEQEVSIRRALEVKRPTAFILH